jgi:hypothetical protein
MATRAPFLTTRNDTVVRVPPAPTAEDDKQLMRTTVRKLAESYLARPPLLAPGDQVTATSRRERWGVVPYRRGH